MKNVYYLDACALLAVFKQEDGYVTVADIYEEAAAGSAVLCMSMVNLLEVYYGLVYDFGAAFAKERLSEVTESIVQITDLTLPKLVEAGRIKTSYKLSLADSIAIAEASVSGGTLVTADHHEMDKVEQREPGIKFLWIRDKIVRKGGGGDQDGRKTSNC
jgi:PIN domain nuclease of toxin-antitoxin system